jgi:microcystin-dependent protein
MVDGTSPQFGHLPHNVGGYWDHAGSSVPAWVSNCTVPPYLNCDGSAFNGATYPALRSFLNGTTLPDARGRFRAVLNQTTGRITTASGGVDGDTILASGGGDSVTLLSSAMPTHTHTANVTDPGHTHTISPAVMSQVSGGIAGNSGGAGNPVSVTQSHTTGITVANVNAGSGGAHSIMAPTYVGGLTLVRAA